MDIRKHRLVGKVALNVFRQPEGNTVAVADATAKELDAIRQTIFPNRPPWGDVRLRLVDYYTLQGLGPGDAERQADSLIGRFTHDYATVFAFQVLPLVLSVGVLLSLTLKPLPPHAPGPPRG